ncbi:hypothetical protein K438DRAFT_2111182, partial [Mycena galopus ATCC 62051]
SASAPAPASASASTSAPTDSCPLVLQLERVRTRARSIKPDTTNMTEELVAADTNVRRSANDTAEIKVVKDRMVASSKADLNKNIWDQGNGHMWKIACLTFNNDEVILENYPGLETALPCEAEAYKGAGGWLVGTRKVFHRALDARGTLGEGFRLEKRVCKSKISANIVIFSHDYNLPVPPPNTPEYLKHWHSSSGVALPCADGAGKLWAINYDLDLPDPIISQVPLTTTSVYRSKKPKGKGRGKSKVEDEPVQSAPPLPTQKRLRTPEAVDESQSEEDAPAPAPLPRPKPKATTAAGPAPVAASGEAQATLIALLTMVSTMPPGTLEATLANLAAQNAQPQ